MDLVNNSPINPLLKSPMYGESECLNQAKQGKWQESTDLNQRVKQSEDVPLNLLDLPLDIFLEIFRYLNRRSLLNFEATQRNSEEKTKDGWKWLKVENHVNFPWVNSEKWDYCVSQFFNQYIFIDQYHSVQAPSQEIAGTILSKCSGLPDRFSFIKHYINHDIYRLTNWPAFCPKLDTIELLLKGKEEEEAGESLFRGLLQMKFDSHKIERIEQCFIKAIEGGATSASLLSVAISQEIRGDQEEAILEMNIKLAIKAAEKGDERALCELFLRNPKRANSLYAKTNHFYCALVYLAKIHFDQWKIEEAQQLIDQALQFKEIPLLSEKFLPILYEVGSRLFYASKYACAGKLYAQVFVKYGEQVPAWVFANVALVKMELNQFSEADALYSQAITKYGEQVRGEVLASAAFVKSKLNQFSEADQLYSQAIRKYEEDDEDVPCDVLVDAASVKWQLNQLFEADQLYSRAIRKYEEDEEDVPYDVLVDAASVRSKLKHD